MAHVFISYAHSDSSFAQQLKKNLEQANLLVWLDQDLLQAGEDWRQEIDTAIQGAFALIVVMTPRAFESKYVTYEWAYGLGIGVKVVPIMLEKTTLHPRLEVIQYLDFTNHWDAPWEKLIERLEAVEASYQPPRHIKEEQTNSDVTLKKLIGDLSVKNTQKRRNAIKALRNIGSRAAVPPLIHTLQTDSSPSARVEAAEALVKIGDISASQAFIGALHSDSSILVRSAAARALGDLKSVEAVEALTQVVEGWDRGEEKTKIEAIEALKKIGDRNVVPRLVKTMNLLENNVAAKIIQLVVYFYHATALKQIVPYLDDQAPIHFKEWILQTTVETLERIGSPEALAAVEAWRKQQASE